MANYLKAKAPTLVPTETVDNEEPAPTSMPTTDKATFMMTMMINVKVSTVHDEEHPPTEATESASTSVPIDSVDDEQPDLTKTAEDAPTPIPKDPFTVIIEDSSTLEVEEVSMLSVVSIGVEVGDSTLSKGLFAYL